MNRELLAIAPEMSVREARDLLRSFAVHAAPVVDEERHPLGLVSRDALEGDGERRASDAMTRPAPCADAAEPIEAAARRVAGTDTHHLVVVDADGAAVGMVSPLDLLRALLGMPTHHPPTFPHWDEGTAVSWTDDWPIDEEGLSHAPAAPGVMALVCTRSDEANTVVWAEPCADVHARLAELASAPRDQTPDLAHVLALEGVRYRAAAVCDGAVRARIVSILRDRVEHSPPPGST